MRQVLEFLENKFDSLSFRIKIELIVFPLIICLMLVYLFNYNFKSKDKLTISKSYKIKHISMNQNLLDIAKDIESFCKAHKIELNEISIYKNIINLKVLTSDINKISLLDFIENYNAFSKIKYLELSLDYLDLEISFSKFYAKNKINIKNKIDFLNNKNANKLKVNAIVGKRVLFNNEWLNIGDKISKFKILKIENNIVFLENGINLRIYNENH